MLWHIAWFEIRYWLRSQLLWVFFCGVTLLTLLASSADQIALGTSSSNTFRNAPFVIESRYAFMSLFGLLLCVAFVNFAALRDFSCRTQQLLFSLPTRRRDFLLGRFLGTTLIAIVPMTGISLGILFGKYMPWTNPERWGPVQWAAHFDGLLLFAVPNIFFITAILFAVAVIVRQEAATFVAALVLFMAFVAGNAVYVGLRYESVGALLDPLAIKTFALATKYWTIGEKDTLSAGPSGVLLLNRIIWVGVSCLLFAASYYRFSFTERRPKTPPAHAVEDAYKPDSLVPSSFPAPGAAESEAATLLGCLKIHLVGMLRSNFAIVIGILVVLDIPLLLTDAAAAYGNQTFPVTSWVLSLLREDMSFFVLIVIAYYSGVLVWKDRDERLDEIVDATPAAEWVSYAARLIGLLVIVAIMQAVGLLSGVAVQAIHRFYRFELGVYVHELMLRDMSGFVFLAILAFFLHVLAPNRYLGYFAFAAIYCWNSFVWRQLNVATNLVQFAARPRVVYSDFFGDAPYRLAWNWFTLYWALCCGVIAIATIMFWPRGKQDRWSDRFRIASLRFTIRWKAACALCIIAFTLCGGWIFYNTEVLNSLPGPKDESRLKAEYEKAYKAFDRLPQPHVRGVNYEIDIFPASRNVEIRGEEIIYNPYARPLDEIHFSLDSRYETSIDMPESSLTKDDPRLGYRIYRFRVPLQHGEARVFHFIVRSRNRGFENEASNAHLVQNGTSLSNLGPLVPGAHYLAPVIGYNYWRELTDSVERKKYGLAADSQLRSPERNCMDECWDNYIPGHSDWVAVHSVLSTTLDQIAVAPGSLLREWRKDDRRYFEYQLDHPGTNVYGFYSARYEVVREQWNGITLEVYFLKEHPWNVPRMIRSMKKSLGYYEKNFGPYAHKQARIVEFPRVSEFAAAFPGTMPYSESLGFIANLNHRDDIDTVFYVVSHEMGHQWWDGQVIGAKNTGSTLLSETLAQYSALMVMEQEYGRDMMRKFLRYEMDYYLKGRGHELQNEQPLVHVGYKQYYIFYNKGGLALYYLKEMIGEDAVNRALRTLIQKYAYASPPYPTSYALVDALRAETPPNLQYLIKDLLEEITLFSNRTAEAWAVRRPDGRYDVTVDVEARKFRADGTGNETELPVDDWIDIGAFAKPVDGQQYGDTLYRSRQHITQRRSRFTFITEQQPEKAGIDPFTLLIDRIPDDNLKTIVLTGTGASPNDARVDGTR